MSFRQQQGIYIFFSWFFSTFIVGVAILFFFFLVRIRARVRTRCLSLLTPLTFSKPSAFDVSHLRCLHAICFPMAVIISLTQTDLAIWKEKKVKTAIELLQRSWIEFIFVWRATVECFFKLKRLEWLPPSLFHFRAFAEYANQQINFQCMRNWCFAIGMHIEATIHDNHD